MTIKTVCLAAGLTLAAATHAIAAQPALIISEVAPWASGNASYAADWFELTNRSAAAIDITGWKFDDNSNAAATAVALRGVTSIAAGESVVFLEGLASGATDATINANFVAAWFGANAPAGLKIGNYGGAGVGLSSNGDAVNIFNAGGTLVTRIDFAASTVGFSFDNTAGLDNAAVSSLSVVGVSGAALSFDGTATGSPGTVTAVPEPETYSLMLAGLVGLVMKRRRAA